MEDPPRIPLSKPTSPHWNSRSELDARFVLLLFLLPTLPFESKLISASSVVIAELWALLHFIMPSLFDSHDEFSEWFSRDIENAAADNKGSNLNEHQLRRLHMILKPFMLRRVKKNVQNELGDKVRFALLLSLIRRPRLTFSSFFFRRRSKSTST